MRRITFDEAYAQYGCDKPDLRFGMEIQDVTTLFEPLGLNFLTSVLQKGGRVGGMHISAVSFSRSDLEGWVTHAQKLGSSGLLWIRLKDDLTIESPIAKFLPEQFIAQLKSVWPDVRAGSIFFFVAGVYKKTWEIL